MFHFARKLIKSATLVSTETINSCNHHFTLYLFGFNESLRNQTIIPSPSEFVYFVAMAKIKIIPNYLKFASETNKTKRIKSLIIVFQLWWKRWEMHSNTLNRKRVTVEFAHHNCFNWPLIIYGKFSHFNYKFSLNFVCLSLALIRLYHASNYT